MKSYFLEGLANKRAARVILSAVLPQRADPWVLLASNDDPIAYFNIVDVSGMGEEADEWNGPFAIAVEVSGRHYDEEEKVLDVLRLLQARLSGMIRDDFDSVL